MDLKQLRRRSADRRVEAFLESRRFCDLQGDQSIANQSGASFRSDLNNELQALATVSSGATAPATTYQYQLWADTTNGLLKQRNSANTAWLVRGSLKESFVQALSANYTVLGSDWAQVFKCSGTFTLSLTAAATLGDGFIFTVINAGVGVITIDPNGSEQIDSATTITIPAGTSCIVFCNGSALNTVGRPAPSTSLAVTTRQTVLSGPVDANGYSNFGGATGGTTLTISGTIIATAANGFGANGNVDVVGSAVNPGWTGLSTNGTWGLFADIAAGALTPVNGCLPLPVYEWGGTPSITAGQLTFNIQAMQGFLGNGATAPAAARVCLGEVTVAGGVVTSIVWYALQARYDSGEFGITLSTVYTNNHNLGIPPRVLRYILRCKTAEGNWSIGDELDISQWFATSATAGSGGVVGSGRLTSILTTTPTNSPGILDKTGHGFFSITIANWKYDIFCERGW